MTHLILKKSLHGWIPDDPVSIEFFGKQKLGSNIHGDFKQMRQVWKHRKFFALLNLAYEYWEPGEINSEYGTPEKNFDRFREDLTILAGYYKIVIRLDGSAKPEAESIKFGKMDNETFDKLYENVLTVVLRKIEVLKDMTADEVNALVDQVIGFA